MHQAHCIRVTTLCSSCYTSFKGTASLCEILTSLTSLASMLYSSRELYFRMPLTYASSTRAMQRGCSFSFSLFKFVNLQRIFLLLYSRLPGCLCVCPVLVGNLQEIVSLSSLFISTSLKLYIPSCTACISGLISRSSTGVLLESWVLNKQADIEFHCLWLLCLEVLHPFLQMILLVSVQETNAGLSIGVQHRADELKELSNVGIKN